MERCRTCDGTGCVRVERTREEYLTDPEILFNLVKCPACGGVRHPEAEKEAAAALLYFLNRKERKRHELN